jgi:peptide/nickel transport system permease protein
MLTFIIRRIVYSIPVLILASVLVFFFVHATTDPLARFRTRDPNTSTEAGLRIGVLEKPCTRIGPEHMILKCQSTPLWTQYTRWARNFVRGDMGESFVTSRAVSTEIRSHLWNTIQLIIWGVVISAIVAVAIGVFSAVRQYSALDYAFTGLSFVGLSMPPFWFGLIAIQFLSFELKEALGLKTPIFFSIGLHSAAGAGFGDYLRHLALPVLTLTIQIIAEWSRYQRASMLDVMSADYIRTARAKGLSEAKVIGKHALRNALIPLVTVMAVDIGALFGGLLVTEQIFSWPGMGKLFIDSLLNGDTNVLLPWLMVVAIFIIAFNLLADVLYSALDPRIRLA